MVITTTMPITVITTATVTMLTTTTILRNKIEK